jgi:hypothetical protein
MGGTLAQRREMWREMLGLDPLPERTPLEATVTGTLERGDYVVEKIHFQSLPGAYVVGNLYRPAEIEGTPPAVLYLCGHTLGKVNDPTNPTRAGSASTATSPWCSTPSSWASPRGSPRHVPRRALGLAQPRLHADGHRGLERMRALDYLETRDDVDPERMGVTGAQRRRRRLLVPGRGRRTAEGGRSGLPDPAASNTWSWTAPPTATATAPSGSTTTAGAGPISAP